MRTLLLIFYCLSTLLSHAQDVSGTWYGLLKTGATDLRINIELIKKDSGYSGKFISVDQGNATLPLQSVKLDGVNLSFSTSMGNISYAGQWENDQIIGTFSQGGQKLPLNFQRTAIVKKILKRPQEPKPPFPYREEEVKFINAVDTVTLAGTLTLPSSGNNFPAVILISGSGGQNRNEELFGHKPFLVLADHLTRNGIAVLRYDDRGVGKSTGNHNGANSLDFSHDAEAAVAFLKTRPEIAHKKIGLVGHSEGGLIAPMVAARNSDVAFIILMAGTGVPGKEILAFQNTVAMKAQGIYTNDMAAANRKQLDDLTNIISMPGEPSVIASAFIAYVDNVYSKLPDSTRKATNITQFRMQYAPLFTTWMKFFLTYDPATALEKIRIPVLVLNGSKDMQVSPSQNLPPIEAALKKAGNSKYMIMEMPGLNHFFQECKTGMVSEYADIEQTLSPIVLKEITNFITTLSH
jgi:pimeloyl-ACP methyl ester carboxylesterase